MPTVTLEDKGCRGCTMCVDICPVEVFGFDESAQRASVQETEDCVGCLSCTYLCPSECIEITDVELARPFHRSEENAALIEKFWQAKMPSKVISVDDLIKARGEIGMLLLRFGSALDEIIGRGQKAVGRRAGNVSATHLPEMWDDHDKDLDKMLMRLRRRSGASFPFDHSIAGDEITLTAEPCGLSEVVAREGEVGKHVLCQLFHEYWAGMISSFMGKQYSCEAQASESKCVMTLAPK